jgi:filamentous hemagglutinin
MKKNIQKQKLTSFLKNNNKSTIMNLLWSGYCLAQNFLVWIAVFALTFQPLLANAQQVRADTTSQGSQQPTILSTTNGIPLVNITTPSASGVSVNNYSHFNVNSNGLIFNNSRTSTTTQLGGWVGGNPWLAGGTARVIVNQVTSSNPSLLGGYMEIAGNRAELVIANPNGITCNGCGVINASRSTLTTGTAQIDGSGSLTGYAVSQGTVTIGGAGYDASSTDYASILARAVQVNSSIWARDLTVITGANNISRDLKTITSRPVTGATPAFALDVAALGGMYAGKIKLIGTEQGLGVRNSGAIVAQAGTLRLSNNGNVSNTGTMRSATKTYVSSRGTVTNSGTIYGAAKTKVKATNAVVNQSSGTIASEANTYITAGSVNNLGILAGGLASNGTLGSSGDLIVSVEGIAALTGLNLAAGRIEVTATSINLTGTPNTFGGQALTLLATSGDIEAKDAILGSGGLASLTANQGAVILDRSIANFAAIQLSAKKMSNDAGLLQLSHTTALSTLITTDSVNNNNGLILSNGSLLLKAGGTLNNTNGQIVANKTLLVEADSLVNTGGKVLAGNHLVITANMLGGNGSYLSDGNLELNTSGSFNLTGTVQSYGASLLNIGQNFINSGNLTVGDMLVINATSITNLEQGNIKAGAAGFFTPDFTNTKGQVWTKGNLLIAANSTGAAANSIKNDQGRIESASGDIYLSANSIQNLGLAPTYNLASSSQIIMSQGNSQPADPTGLLNFLLKPDILGVTNQPKAQYAAAYAKAFEELMSGQALSSTSLAIIDAAYVNTSTGVLNSRYTPSWSQLTTTASGIGQNNMATFMKDLVKPEAFDANGNIKPDYAERYAALWIALSSRAGIATDIKGILKPTVLGTDGELLSGYTQVWTTITAPSGQTFDIKKIITSDTLNNDGRMAVIAAGGSININAGVGLNLFSAMSAGRNVNIAAFSFHNVALGATQTQFEIWKSSPCFSCHSSKIQYGQTFGGLIEAGGNVTINTTNNFTNQTIPTSNNGYLYLASAEPHLAASAVNLQPTLLPFPKAYVTSGLRLEGAADKSNELSGLLSNLTIASSPQVSTPGATPQVTNPQTVPVTSYQAADQKLYTDLQLYTQTLAASQRLNQETQTAPAASSFSFINGLSWLASSVNMPTSSSLFTAPVSNQVARIGAGMSGNNVVLSSGGAITFEGVIDARTGLGILSQSDLTLTGKIASAGSSTLRANGNLVLTDALFKFESATILAKGDVTLTAASINTFNTLEIQAGGELAINAKEITTEGTRGGGIFKATMNVGSQLNAGGDLVLKSDSDITLAGSNFNVAGDANILAQGSITLASVVNSLNYDSKNKSPSLIGIGGSGGNYAYYDIKRNQGNTLNVGGDLLFMSGEDFSATAAQVAAKGNLTLISKGNVDILAAQDEILAETKSTHTKDGFFSSKTTVNYHYSHDFETVASSFSGQEMNIISGGTAKILGSSLVSVGNLSLLTEDDLKILATLDTHEGKDSTTVTTSGLMGAVGGGFGFSIGTREVNDTTLQKSQVHIASLVGSLMGDVTILSGGELSAVGSVIQALFGDVSLSGKAIELKSAMDNYYTKTNHSDHFSGFSFSIGAGGDNPIASVTKAYNLMNAADKAKDPKAKMLYQIAAGLNLYQGVKGIAELDNLDKLLSVDLTIGYGERHLEIESISASQKKSGGVVTAGKDFTAVATEGDITAIGAELTANQIFLSAAKDINLLSQALTSSSESRSSFFSFFVGLVASVGVDGLGLGVTANASSSKSSSWSNSITHAETLVKGTSLVSMNSGGNMLLQGAQVSAATIRAIVAGDLTLISEQDSAKQKADMSSWSVSATVKSNSASVSGSYNEGKAAGNYLSVLEQTGFFAGTGGFDVKVGGTTSLTGAALASEAEATKNRLMTGAIRTADLVNASDWFAKSWGVSASFSTSGKGGISPAFPGNEKGSSSGQTLSTVALGDVIITNAGLQNAKTGLTPEAALQALHRYNQAQNKQADQLPGALSEKLQNQADVSAAFGEASSATAKLVGDISSKFANDANKAIAALEKKAKEEGGLSPEDQAALQEARREQDLWKEGGMGRALLHTLSQGVLGGIGGGSLTAALEAGGGAFLASMLAPRLNEAIKDSLKDAGLDPKTNAILSSLLSEILTTTLASSFGGIAGATAASVDMNNRQLHTPKEKRIEPSIKECDGNGENCKFKPAYEGGFSVGGKTYSDSRYIPGNEPVPVYNADGSPMLDPDGDPVYRPKRAATLEEIGKEAQSYGMLDPVGIGHLFKHSGKYDYQRMKTDDGKPIFMVDYTSYSNIHIGYAYAAVGYPWQFTSTIANRYASWNNTKYEEGTTMHSYYTNLPSANITMYQIGANAYKAAQGAKK